MVEGGLTTTMPGDQVPGGPRFVQFKVPSVVFDPTMVLQMGGIVPVVPPTPELISMLPFGSRRKTFTAA
jgi:hypothetical protein